MAGGPVRRRRFARTAALAMSVVLAAGIAGCTPETGGRAVPVPSTARAAPSGPVRLGSNVPMTRLAPGQRPPQFVLFSFDGVGVGPNWNLFLDTAKATDARFSALMTGLYFLTDAARKKYRGPGHRPGESAINFGGSKAEVIEEIEYLNKTWYAGHEMGTHFVGHFCRGTSYPGAQWTTADWNHELDQFFSLMVNWRKNTGITTGPDLAFGPDVVKGGRTQCLEGSQEALFPALIAHGMIWDSSMAARQPGIFWPEKTRGIWEFPIPYVYSPALKRRQTALDFNYWYTYNGARNRPKDAPRIRRIVRESYEYMYRRAFDGNRAPLVIANHFNQWSGNAFNPATADFMRETCGRPETICATYSDVIEWMELQDPQVLRGWQGLPPVAVDAHR
ncbi:polysaccharide deacetylase [Gordonia sp. PP30]|uniref:polysaccharide deacetylase n=1 Tax=Gordonia sp. PP30 TaxID=2935861 RepID=UPI001FFE4B7F|nr:polysaccharide deacetylase [Gordonia sp. PP30]UQE73997.1 polysaccharide deacetylase [Gordonia sp. PP30]